MTVTKPHTVAEGRQGLGTSQEFLDANGQSFAQIQTPKNENGLQQTLFIRSICVTGCVNPTTPQNSTHLNWPLFRVPAMNKLQQDSQCA
jgi:hypothetical protein